MRLSTPKFLNLVTLGIYFFIHTFCRILLYGVLLLFYLSLGHDKINTKCFTIIHNFMGATYIGIQHMPSNARQN